MNATDLSPICGISLLPVNWTEIGAVVNTFPSGKSVIIRPGIHRVKYDEQIIPMNI